MKTRVNIVVVLFLVLVLMSATALHWVPVLEELVGVGWGVELATPVYGPNGLIVDQGGQ